MDLFSPEGRTRAVFDRFLARNNASEASEGEGEKWVSTVVRLNRDTGESEQHTYARWFKYN